MWDIHKDKNWWDSDEDDDSDKVRNKKKDKNSKENDIMSDEDSDISLTLSSDGEDEGGASSNDDFNPFKDSDSGDGMCIIKYNDVARLVLGGRGYFFVFMSRD